MGALMAAIEAENAGYRVAYLGANLPVEEIAAAAQRLGANVVALSLVYPPDDPRLGAELERLRGLLGREATILVGGGAAAGYTAALGRIGAVVVRDLAEFSTRVDGRRTVAKRSRGR